MNVTVRLTRTATSLADAATRHAAALAAVRLRALTASAGKAPPDALPSPPTDR